MERGEISYSKVREITRVADAATEEYLLMIAIHGTALHVERLVRHFRRAQESEELSREAQQQVNRSLQLVRFGRIAGDPRPAAGACRCAAKEGPRHGKERTL